MTRVPSRVVRIRAPSAPLVAALLLAACSASDGRPSGMPTELPHFTTGAPTLEIGAVEGDERYVFAAIESVIRLGDGTIAVSDAGATRISLYDDRGEYLRSWGSEGEGPTEFRALSRIYPLGSDSLMAAERYGGRVVVFDGAGTLARELRAPALSGDTTFALDSWLHGRFWIDGALLARERDAVRRALDRLPPPRSTPGYRAVRVAAGGDLWVEEPGMGGDAGSGDVVWTRLSADGTPLAAVSTPAGFRLTHAAGDELLGVWTGESGVHFVRAYTVAASGATRPMPPWLMGEEGRAGADAAVDTAAVRALMIGSVKNLASAQEIHYSTAFTYTTSLAALERFEKPEGLEVDFVQAGTRGWSAVFTHPGLDTVCGLAYGADIPPGWTPGMVVCAPGPADPAEPGSASGGGA